MKTPVIVTLILLLLSSCGGDNSESNRELADLYELLDNEIARSDEYDARKEQRIARLRHEYDLTTDKRIGTELINRLIQEFDAYNADSTLYYVSYNLRRPAVREVPGEYTRLMIKRADVFSHAGLFSDALSTMQSIPRDSLSPELLEAYYTTYSAIYQYLSEYHYEHFTAAEYEMRRNLYADSVNMVVEPGSYSHMVYVMADIARNGDPRRAITELSKHMDEYESGSREYSILASTLSFIYKLAGDSFNYKKYLVLSAISDTRGAVKENMSYREFASVMFDKGDIKRADRYIKKSIADANFYSAYMRNAQSSKILPMIDEANTTLQESLNRRVRTMMWLSIILSSGLIVTIIFILKQYKRLHRANARINAANVELSQLSGQMQVTNSELQMKNAELNSMSDELRSTNRQLGERNAELSNISKQLSAANETLATRNKELYDFNRTKEQYAGLFMEYCSSAISTLQHYQQSLRVLTAQGGNRAALMKRLESSEIAEQLLKNFYGNFDEAILSIYPSFINKFNALLKPDEQVVLKSGELLNTELRIFALIRIGIDDSVKIAKFLRCSISTIYTYRSKMRKRAVNPESFEADVRNIG